MRLRITASPSEIFPGGKVIYFLWKCDILLSQYEICLRHVKVSLRDDFNNKKEFRKNCGIPFFIHFFDRKNFIAKLFHTPPGVFHSFAKAKLFHCVSIPGLFLFVLKERDTQAFFFSLAKRISSGV